jgi:hypothetical protein
VPKRGVGWSRYKGNKDSAVYLLSAYFLARFMLSLTRKATARTDNTHTQKLKALEKTLKHEKLRF